MKTSQFFNLNLNVNLTMNDLYDIRDALFVAEHQYNKEGYNAIVNRIREVSLKIDKQIDTINDICK